MGAVAVHRKAIIDTAVRLFRKQGYAATGLNQIVAESGAPKGSLYHYFPGGKTAIAQAALIKASIRVVDTLQLLSLRSNNPATVFREYCLLMAGWMKESDYRDGCPITTMLLETTPQLEPMRLAGAQALGLWAAQFERLLILQAVAPARAARLSRVAIAALEGALLQMRVSKDDSPLVDVAEEVSRLFESAISAPAIGNQ